VLGALAAAGIAYAVDPLLVRGLDYYNRTVFEVVPNDDERAQGTLGGGGRYDGLMELLGGPPTPGIGFGSGIERLILEMQKNGVTFDDGSTASVYVVHRAEGAGARVFALAAELRDLGIPTLIGETGKSMKAQMRAANHSGARFAVIVGDDEWAAGHAVLKDLSGESEQESLAFGAVARTIEERFRA
jgi:histidyl-tRNA synthetase